MPKGIENITKRKATGGRIVSYRGRRKFEIDRYPVETTLGEDQTIVRRTRGGNIAVALKTAGFVNVYDSSTKKSTRIKIVAVLKNPSSQDYQRRGIITKGSILQTEIGEVLVVSRPSQHGVVNGILQSKKV